MINMKSKKFYVLVFQSNYNEQDKKKKIIKKHQSRVVIVKPKP